MNNQTKPITVIIMVNTSDYRGSVKKAEVFDGRVRYGRVNWDDDGESASSAHTVWVRFSGPNRKIEIDGDAWRDLENSALLDDFIIEVVCGQSEAEKFLDFACKASSLNTQSGEIILDTFRQRRTVA